MEQRESFCHEVVTEITRSMWLSIDYIYIYIKEQIFLRIHIEGEYSIALKSSPPGVKRMTVT